MKRTPYKKPETIHLDRFGCINKLMFDDGGYVEAQMQGLELARLCESVHQFVLRRQKIPDPKVLAALETVERYFSPTGPGVTLTVKAKMPIAQFGVDLQVIDPSHRDLQRLLRRRRNQPAA